MQAIIITISGGVVEVRQKPAGVQVIIRDYDIDGVDDDRLTKDAGGVPCFEENYPEDQAI